MRVVGEVGSAEGLEGALADTPCDVLLLDLQMERWALDDVSRYAIRAKVVVLTASESLENAVIAMRLGASAVVYKRFAVQTLVSAVRAVAGGQVWMPPSLQAEVAVQWGNSQTKLLTDREMEIVRLVASGLRNSEAAKRLTISESTVKTHLNNIFHKLELRDRLELALYALRHGIVMPPDRESGSGTKTPRTA
jgi:DNA-binding NarL/FixJ family response regulator